MKKAYHSTTGGSAFCLRSKSFSGQAGGKHSAFCSPRRSLWRSLGILHSAFTLIELLIVMVVVTILVGITIPVSKYVSYRARLANQRIYIEKIKSALEDYRAAYGEYPITPTNSGGGVINVDDVKRHYPDNYETYCAAITQGFNSASGYGNSPYTDVCLATNTVENVGGYYIDYCLTYPLMLRQRLEGARPFMEFKDATVTYLVYHPKQQVGQDVGTVTRWFRTTAGDLVPKYADYIRGNRIKRPKAVDPVTQKQWKYTSVDGVTYTLTVHTNEAGF